jgi:beta-xylosidase
MKYNLLILLSLVQLFPCMAQKAIYKTPGNGNPILPGYFSDPTVKKFGDTYYIYATTDDNIGGRPSQVWTSKDFVNWTMLDMNWPKTPYYWSPDVMFGPDSNYYLYYSQPCMIYGAKSKTPVGPWTGMDPIGNPLIPDRLIPEVRTLDGQTFKDDDGKYYMYWGTWGNHKNSGFGIGIMNTDMKSFSDFGFIPNPIPNPRYLFGAPFVFKKDDIYYFTYSLGSGEDATYKVQYAISRTGPMGPFKLGKNNPILSTNNDSTIYGPGHHSIINEGNDYYIIYHRHDNPHSNDGLHHQIAADKLIFGTDGTIEKVVPTHEGIGYLCSNTNPFPNLAYTKKVTASSYYSDDFMPDFAVDDNNGTLWIPANNKTPQWLQVDLGKIETVKRTHIQFQYPTKKYQYLIEYSINGKKWNIYADKRNNYYTGSPLIDSGHIVARYLKLTITGFESTVQYAAIWNFKVFGNSKLDVQQMSMISSSSIARTVSNIDNRYSDIMVAHSGSCKHTIGEAYGGGIVFYVYDNGQHGLIAATADQSAGIRWYGGSYTNTCARADGVGAGKANTAIIIANQGSIDGNAFAATLCNEYSVTVGGVTYSDWYLPSKFELNLLRLQKDVVGGIANGHLYWSSTEASHSSAWYQNLWDGWQNYSGKANPGRVRAIRAF